MKKALTLTMLLLLIPANLRALESSKAWKIIQITDSDGCVNGNPRVNASGERVFFISDCDYADKNLDRSREIFIWEKNSIRQITDFNSCPILDFDVDGEERKIVFTSSCLLEDEERIMGTEIMVMEGRKPPRLITAGAGYPSGNPKWSSDGRTITFQSNADFTGENPDHGIEIFMADIGADPPEFKQLTKGEAGEVCDSHRLVGDVMVCRCDIESEEEEDEFDRMPFSVMGAPGRRIGSNVDDNREIFKVELNGKNSRLTDTKSCDNGGPAFHPAGRAVAFPSNCLFDPEKPSQTRNIYFAVGDKIIKAFPGIDFHSAEHEWSGDGKKLVFTSDYHNNLVGDEINIDRSREIFVIEVPIDDLGLASQKERADFKMPAAEPLPVTDFQYYGAGSPHPSMDAHVIVFVSTTAWEMENTDHNPEIFMAVLKDPEFFDK